MDKRALSEQEHILDCFKQSTLDNLSETIAKAVAMIEVALCADFWTCEQRTQYDYCWILSDLISHAKKLCEQLESPSSERGKNLHD